MKSVVVVPGRPPAWVLHHARNLAHRLADVGRVTLIVPHGPRFEHILPGEVGEATTAGNAINGYPIWSGGLSATLGLRRTKQVTLMVLWPEASPVLAVISGVGARLRGERLLLDIEDGSVPIGTERRTGRWARRLLRSIATSTVVGTAGTSADNHLRTVVALCGDDEELTEAILRAFAGLSEDVADEWRLVLCSDTVGDGVAGHRHADRISVATAPVDAPIMGASVVVAPYGDVRSDLMELAVANGSGGVLVGHPAADNVTRRADGVCLAEPSPSSILVAMELASGARLDGAVSVERLQGSVEQLLAAVSAR